MEVRKLLIAEGTEEFRLALADALKGMYYVRTCRDGQQALDLMRSFGPDIVILDMMLPRLDGITILEKSIAAGICPVVLATTSLVTEYLMDSAAGLGIGYVMRKPCDVGATVARLNDLNQRIRPQTVTRPEPRICVTNVLRSLGIPTKLKGYLYMREAILILAQDPEQTVTKELYPAVAARCGCASINVERAIRSAIESAWKKRDERVWQQYFPPAGDGACRRPTNAEFLNRIADCLALSGNVEG